MKNHQAPQAELWTGRTSTEQLYWHEKVNCVSLENMDISQGKTFAFLGYKCDEGVRRNQGRTGAALAPDAIRKMMATMANHFQSDTQLLDVGNITCETGDLASTHEDTTQAIAQLLSQGAFPIVLGGGHDLAYAHYKAVEQAFPQQKIGVINLDAHFDLRPKTDQAHSGTPFYQIAEENKGINYLCLGIQPASNHRGLYENAKKYKVQYMNYDDFTIENISQVNTTLLSFLEQVEIVYLTIDIDGFSSAIAPGVSAPSPLGFQVDVAIQTIRNICKSGKLKSVDLVEMNPNYDVDNSTARLASRLVFEILNY